MESIISTDKCVWQGGSMDMLAERHSKGIFGFGEKDMQLQNADKLNKWK